MNWDVVAGMTVLQISRIYDTSCYLTEQQNTVPHSASTTVTRVLENWEKGTIRGVKVKGKKKVEQVDCGKV